MTFTAVSPAPIRTIAFTSLRTPMATTKPDERSATPPSRRFHRPHPRSLSVVVVVRPGCKPEDVAVRVPDVQLARAPRHVRGRKGDLEAGSEAALMKIIHLV